MELMFFHGLESGPHGRKYKALKERFPGIVSPDFTGMRDVETRMAHAEKVTEGKSGLLIVGSSFGGLCAALLAHRFPDRVAGYVLCAPALHWKEADEITRTPGMGVMIHGAQDDVVPFVYSEVFATKHGIPLRVVTDGHRLSNSRDLIVRATESLAGHINSANASSEQ